MTCPFDPAAPFEHPRQEMTDTTDPVEVLSREPITHDLKVWPSFWPDLDSGAKPFEIRKWGRDFRKGDKLRLSEFDAKSGYTGRTPIERTITYVFGGGQFGIDPEFCVLGLAPPAIAGVPDILRAISIFTIEEDEAWLNLKIHGEQIARMHHTSKPGIALLKLDAGIRAALSPEPLGQEAAPVGLRSALEKAGEFIKQHDERTWDEADGVLAEINAALAAKDMGDRAGALFGLFHFANMDLADGVLTIAFNEDADAKAAFDIISENAFLSTGPSGPSKSPKETRDAVIEALQWYATQVAGCRKVTSEGNDARRALDQDGGKRAREALSVSADIGGEQ